MNRAKSFSPWGKKSVTTEVLARWAAKYHSAFSIHPIGRLEEKTLQSTLDSKEIKPLWVLVMDRKAWSAAAHGVTKSWTRLSD